MTPEISTISIALCNFIKENLIAEGVEITTQTPFEQLELDSFSIIEIVLFIERKFGLTLPDGALTKENVHSVASLSNCVYQNLVTK